MSWSKVHWLQTHWNSTCLPEQDWSSFSHCFYFFRWPSRRGSLHTQLRNSVTSHPWRSVLLSMYLLYLIIPTESLSICNCIRTALELHWRLPTIVLHQVGFLLVRKHDHGLGLNCKCLELLGYADFLDLLQKHICRTFLCFLVFSFNLARHCFCIWAPNWQDIQCQLDEAESDEDAKGPQCRLSGTKRWHD